MTYWSYVCHYWLRGHTHEESERLAAAAVTRDQKRREGAAIEREALDRPWVRLLRTLAGAATTARLPVARVPMLRPRRKRPIVIVVPEIPERIRADDPADKDAVHRLGVRTRGAAAAPNHLAGVDPPLEMRPPAEVLLVVTPSTGSSRAVLHR